METLVEERRVPQQTGVQRLSVGMLSEQGCPIVSISVLLRGCNPSEFTLSTGMVKGESVCLACTKPWILFPAPTCSVVQHAESFVANLKNQSG